jgi:hypothetical protein
VIRFVSPGSLGLWSIDISTNDPSRRTSTDRESPALAQVTLAPGPLPENTHTFTVEPSDFPVLMKASSTSKNVSVRILVRSPSGKAGLESRNMARRSARYLVGG